MASLNVIARHFSAGFGALWQIERQSGQEVKMRKPLFFKRCRNWHELG
jgi:hypothetical protein